MVGDSTPILTIGGGNMQLLWEKKQTIDLGRVGIISSSLNDLYINEGLANLVYNSMEYGVAQAMLQGIGGGRTESALCIRELTPYLDLLDGNGGRITHNQWIQNNYYGWSWRQPGDNSQAGIPVYITSKESKNDQKVMVLYGIEFINGFKRSNVEEIQFWITGVKLISRIFLNRNQKHPMFKGSDDGIYDIICPPYEKEEENSKFECSVLLNKNNLVYHNNMIIFNTPILIKKDDLITIKFIYNPMDVNQWSDEIKIKGIVVEPFGMM